jgi:hypothetical protein
VLDRSTEKEEAMTGVIGLVVFLVIIGVALELLKTQIPMDSTIRVVIQVVIVIAVVFYLLAAFGIADLPIPRVRG